MKVSIKKILFQNRAPFEKFEINMEQNQISMLGGANGRGKTTILSHITDMFTELAKGEYEETFASKQNAFYRVSSHLFTLKTDEPSFVYIQIQIGDTLASYFDFRGSVTRDNYNAIFGGVEHAPTWESVQSNFSKSTFNKFFHNFDKKNAKKIFESNITTYFPAYRFEQPGYLNDPYKINMDFRKDHYRSTIQRTPLEATTSLRNIANWVLDVVLDLQYNTPEIKHLNLLLNRILTQTLISKNVGNCRFGIGQRNFGGARVQVVVTETGASIYPSIFNLSSGELALLTLFGEILRQTDIVQNGKNFQDVTGVILIDEIDKHLHIKIQKDALPTLMDIFPNVQFILTSHSPFVKMGMEMHLPSRSAIFDLDNHGQRTLIENMDLYKEVYDIFISENDRFKHQLESIQEKINLENEVQIITEGANTRHIKKAIEILAPDLLNKVNIITGAEDKSGTQQLKNSFEVMKFGRHQSKFLFVWDCDAIGITSGLTENDHFKALAFRKNLSNSLVRKGIENLYPPQMFTDDMYSTEDKTDDYGAKKTIQTFEKSRFIEMVENSTDQSLFENFKELIEKIRSIIVTT